MESSYYLPKEDVPKKYPSTTPSSKLKIFEKHTIVPLLSLGIIPLNVQY